MKKIIAAFLCLIVSIWAQAQGPNSRTMREIKMDFVGNSMVPLYMQFPGAGIKCFRMLDGDFKDENFLGPICPIIGSGLVVDTSVSPNAVKVSVGVADVNGLQTALDGKANTLHNQTSSTISDSTSAGRSILTAADYAAQRGLLSVLSASEIGENFYPISSNPSGFLTGITSGQVTGALGFTPYNSTNPSGYITSAALSPYLTSATAASTYATSASMTTALAAKQNTLSLTTIGSGAATLVGATLNIPTPAAATPFNYSSPAAKTVAVSTAYQAADPTKAAVITMSPACTNSTTVLASSACTLQVRQSPTSGLTCSNGTVLLTWTSTVNLGLVFTAGNGFPFDVKLPIGGYFIVCSVAGTFTLSANEQSAG